MTTQTQTLTYLTTALVFGALLQPRDALAEKKGPTYRRNRGRIVWQAKAFATFGTEKEFGKLVRKARRNKALKKNAKGRWSLHFIAFLRSAPKASQVNLVWYRLGKKREQVDFTEFTVPPDGVTLQASATLSPTAGFKVGDRLEGRVTRLISGKEKVYARCRLTLK
ncbi:MAG: hypothetical protein CSA65_04930 [Proteobacteria bacterium]|nr:MAG: hypothetical protein CSB49_05600 [Pseudomonadota bacterium]PIE18461.1 MAG: hypothetical protein CSA65_04930 [Pseudomonadota bacterium]